MPEETIGDWTVQQLVRFLETSREENPPTRIPVLTIDEVSVIDKAIIIDEIQLSLVQTTVGTAGSATALPANPEGYFRVIDNTGQTRVIPFYKA